jgi:hypothetical protein
VEVLLLTREELKANLIKDNIKNEDKRRIRVKVGQNYVRFYILQEKKASFVSLQKDYSLVMIGLFKCCS